MKNAASQSATSLPRAPREDSSARFVKYMIMMAIRVGCFIAMVLITPYGWYTWVFAAGAVFLPYIAVVFANVGQEGTASRAVDPGRAIDAPPAAPVVAEAPDAAHPDIIRITETPRENEA
ncbi:DUF3099 domain-containing protein [Microbacterium sp. NPDC089189]|uniref:DUF3099 domain-containing protein n=1 Tax=Microbacterium sp. NPDC089189 TaxID=3154972 RepID=UPI003422BACB